MVMLAWATPELRDVPLIVCSADVTTLRERSQDFARVGNVYTLEKPFAIEDVEQAIQLALDGKAPPNRRLPPTGGGEAFLP